MAFRAIRGYEKPSRAAATYARGQDARDLTGRVFGRWTVIGVGEPELKQGVARTQWACRCACGTVKSIPAARLRYGTSTSCGCYQREFASARSHKHGQAQKRRTATGKLYGTPAYEMVRGARTRAKRRGLPCNITLDDIVIPEKCPVFGTPLIPTQLGRPGPNSPSLDRIVPSRGYIKDNICVISHRANFLKHDATVEELEAVIAYMRRMQK